MIKPIGFMDFNFTKSQNSDGFINLKEEEKQRIVTKRKELNKIRSNNGVKQSFDYKHFYTGNTDAEGNLSKLKEFKRITTQGGEIYSFDIETLGMVKGMPAKSMSANASDVDLASITELGLYKKVFDKKGNMIKEEALFGGENQIKLGIDPLKREKYEMLLKRAETNFKILSPTEKSTIQRLAFYIDPQSTSRDLSKAQQGLEQLVKEGEEFKKGFKNYDDAFEHHLTRFTNLVNDINGEGKLLVGYNTNKFDIPFINNLAKQKGYATKILGKNHLDLLEPINFSLKDDLFGLHNKIQKSRNINLGIKTGFARLENFAKSFGFVTKSHNAAADSKATIDIVTEKIKNDSLLDIMIEKSSNKVHVNSEQINHEIIQNKIFGFRTSGKLKEFDSVFEDGKSVDYLSYGANRKNFYETKGIDFIPKEKLTQEIIDAYNVEDGLYSATFNNVSTKRNQQAIIYRKTKTEIFNVLRDNSEVYDRNIISQKFIDTATKEYNLDKARRRFEGMFKANERGFGDFKKFVTAYSEAKKIDPSMNKEGIEKLFDSKNPNLNKMFPSLTYNGEIQPSQAKTFIEMFNILDDSNELFEPLMKEVDALKFVNGEGKPVSKTQNNAMQTRTLNDSLDELFEQVEINKDDVFYKPQLFDITALDEIDIMKSNNVNEYTRMNIGNRDKFTYSLLNNIKNEIQPTELDVVNEQRKLLALNNVAEDLIKRNLLDENVLVKANKLDNTSSYYLANAIATNMHNKHAKFKNDIKKRHITINNIRKHSFFKENIKNYHKQSIRVLSTDINYPIDEFSKERIHQTVKKNSANVQSKNVFFSIYSKGNENQALDLINTLKNEFGYEDKYIKNLSNILEFYKKDGFSIAFFEEDNILKLGMQYAKDSSEKSVKNSRLYEKIMNGEKPKDLIEIKLPRVRKGEIGSYLELGGIEKINESSIKGFYSQKNKNKIGINRITFQESDVLNDAIGGLRIGRKKTTEHMINGFDAKRAEQNLNNLVQEPLNLAPGHSSHKTIMNGAEKITVPFPNPKDYLVEKYQIDIKSLSNFLPYIYDKAVKEGNDKLVNEMETVFSDQYSTGQNRLKKLKYKVDNITSFNGTIDYDKDLNVDAKAWFIRNLFSPEDVEGEIKQEALIDYIKAINKNKDIEPVLNELSETGSMINKAKLTAHGKAFKVNPINFVPLGFMSDQSRDVVLQGLSAEGIDLKNEKYTKEFLEKMKKENDISLGRDFSVHFASEYDKLVKNKAEYGLMGNLEQTTSRELYKRFDNFRNEINRMPEEEVIKTFGFYKNELNKSIEKYMANSDLYENSMLLNPTVKESFFNDKRLMSVKYDTDKNVKFKPNDKVKIGMKIKKGEEVGKLHYPNGEIKSVIHKKETGFIRSFKPGKIFLEPEKTQTNSVKIIVENVEKGMGFIADPSDAGKFLWNKLIGKDISLLTRTEEVKHGAFNLRYSGELNKIIKRSNEIGGEEPQKLIDRLNKNKKLGFNASLVDGKITIKGNPKAKGGYIQELINITKEYRENDKYKDTLKNENVLRVFFSQGQHQDIYSSQGQIDEIGKGVKINGRLLDSVVMRVGTEEDGFKYQEKVNGKYQSISQPIYDNLLERSRKERYSNGKLTEFGKAKQDTKNIKAVLDYTADNRNALDESIKIAKIDLDQLGDIKGLRSADALRESIYKTNEMGESIIADVFELDLGDINILDPITEKETNKVLIPFLHSNVIGENVVNSNAQKSVGDFINNINKLKEGKVENINEAKKQINNSYIRMLNQFSGEMRSVKSQTGEKLESGRIDFSGQLLSGNIISPEYEDEARTILVNKHYMTDDLIEVLDDGTKKYNDIAYASKDYLKSLSVDYKKIGESVQSADNDYFRKYVKEVGITDINALDKHFFEELGEKYIKEVGIDAQVFRYPTILSTSHRAMKIRLDDSLDGKVISLFHWTIDALNDDSDGDTPIAILNLKEDGSLYEKKSKLSIAHKKTMEAQSFDNANGIEGLVEKYNSDNFATTQEDFNKKIEKKFGKTISELDETSNKSRDIIKVGTTINSKTAKDEIGLISNPNYSLREAMTNVLVENEQHLKDRNTLIKDFTDLTEQKLLDTKHEKLIEKNIAVQYSQSMTDIANGKEEGFESMRQILRKKIHVGEDGEEKTNKVIDALRRTFDNETVKEKYSNAMIYKNENRIVFNSSDKKNLSYVNSNEIAVTPTEKRINAITNSFNNAHIINFEEGDTIINNEYIKDNGFITENPNKLETEVYKVKNIDRKNYDIHLEDSKGKIHIVKPEELNVTKGTKANFEETVQHNIRQKRDYIISESIRNINEKTKENTVRKVHENRAKFFNETDPSKGEINEITKRHEFRNIIETSMGKEPGSIDAEKINKAYERVNRLSPSTKEAYSEAHDMFFKDKMPIHDEFRTKLIGLANSKEVGIFSNGSETKSILEKFNNNLLETNDLNDARKFGNDLLVEAFENHKQGFKINEAAKEQFNRDLYRAGHKKIKEANNQTRKVVKETLENSKVTNDIATKASGKFAKYGQAVDETIDASIKTSTDILKKISNTSIGKMGAGVLLGIGAGIALKNISNNAPEVNTRREMPYGSNGSPFRMSNNFKMPTSSYKNISDGKPKGNITVRAKTSDDNIRIDELRKIFNSAAKSNLNVKIDDNLNTVDDTWIQDKLISFL